MDLHTRTCAGEIYHARRFYSKGGDLDEIVLDKMLKVWGEGCMTGAEKCRF